VVDKNGRPLSECPPVTLSIVSCPGEFPTGPSITVAPDSDITIRDGAAAMEFRSYYSGKTVIRASSPGLKDATVQITSRGEPRYVAGKTPAVMPRPYVHFTEASLTNAVLTLGRDNPTRTSSEASGHSSRVANDGNPATFWQADAGDANPWIQIDLERMVTVNRTKLTFPAPGNWRYKIEISENGESWKSLFDQTATADVTAERTDVLSTGSISGRFVRVSLTGLPASKAASVAEIEVFGTQSSR